MEYYFPNSLQKTEIDDSVIGGHHTYLLPFLGFRPGLLGLSNLPIDFSKRVKNPSLPRGRPVPCCWKGVSPRN
jgi:hypothetical protein